MSIDEKTAVQLWNGIGALTPAKRLTDAIQAAGYDMGFNEARGRAQTVVLNVRQAAEPEMAAPDSDAPALREFLRFMKVWADSFQVSGRDETTWTTPQWRQLRARIAEAEHHVEARDLFYATLALEVSDQQWTPEEIGQLKKSGAQPIELNMITPVPWPTKTFREILENPNPDPDEAAERAALYDRAASDDTLTRLALWMISADTGASSKALAAVMCGVRLGPMNANTPGDTDDLGRCMRLLDAFPEWKPRIGEMAQVSPIWSAFVDNWPRLTELMDPGSPDFDKDAAGARIMSIHGWRA